MQTRIPASLKVGDSASEKSGLRQVGKSGKKWEKVGKGGIGWKEWDRVESGIGWESGKRWERVGKSGKEWERVAGSVGGS